MLGSNHSRFSGRIASVSGFVAGGLLAASLVGFVAPARALVIVPTFTSSITGDPNAATIEASIDATIARVDADVINPVTVNIAFQEGGGLGSSTTYIATLGYSTYLSALQTNQYLGRSANDNTAIASLPAGPNNPVNGNANVTTTLSLLRALGFAANPPAGQPDGTITLNTSIMNLSRIGPQNPSDYDIQAVAGHEIDEVLGVGGTGSQLPTTNGAVGPLDLFRYSAPGVRSFDTSTSSTPYFSINGGNTDLVHFNQAGGGSDYSDWGDGVSPADSQGNSPPQMQDAFGTPGVDVNIGANELTALDVVGWTLAPTPEPASLGLLVAGAIGLLVRRRHAAI